MRASTAIHCVARILLCFNLLTSTEFGIYPSLPSARAESLHVTKETQPEVQAGHIGSTPLSLTLRTDVDRKSSLQDARTANQFDVAGAVTNPEQEPENDEPIKLFLPILQIIGAAGEPDKPIAPGLTENESPNASGEPLKRNVPQAGPLVTITTADGLQAIPTSVLISDDIAGFDEATLMYRWERSNGQSDADYQGVQSGSSQPILLVVPSEDVGHRYRLIVNDGKGNTGQSNVIAIGPSRIPQLIHPLATEDIHVNVPYFNVQNVTHDHHVPENPIGSYDYEFQIVEGCSFGNWNMLESGIQL
ncbi:MAG: hypothetical protein HY328_09995 [Chloroflexi bacterium]|nr:hypothetical protein [Chloroflexota bacterium]